jgi:hypothetical protein
MIPPPGPPMVGMPTTVVVAVAEVLLVGSNVVELTVAVSVIVLSKPAVTLTVSVSVIALPEARAGAVQLTVPALPGAGAVHDPDVVATLLKLVPAGIAS